MINRAAITLLITVSIANGTTVEMKNGDTLSGKINRFSAETLTLASELSSEPLLIDSNAIQRIIFDQSEKKHGLHGERLTLANGDTIPCKILSLTDKQLKFSTWYAGEFTVARNVVRGIQFGVSEQRIIYNNRHTPLSQWTSRQGSWSKVNDHSSTCRGSAVAARKIDLPKNFRVSYTLGWKGTPNFAFRFCGQNKSATTKQDTYEFTFNSAGMQIRRYVDTGSSGAPLVNIPLKPTSFNTRSVRLDFYINRDDGVITLLVDGNKLGTWPDSFDEPDGNYIIFNNRSSKNSLTFSNLSIADLNDGSLPRHRESIEKSKSDVFLDSTGDIYSGIILSIDQHDSKRIMRIKRSATSTPFKVPENKISSLTFAQPDNTTSYPATDFAAVFHTIGKMQLTELKFNDGFVDAKHPILGNCKIDLQAINQLKKQSTEK